MAEENQSEDRERLPAAGLSCQAAILQARAAEAHANAQDALAQACLAQFSRLPIFFPSAHLLLTIPEAARNLQISERTLRHVLAEPDLHARLVERTRKVGICYKFIPLLPPDLLADLSTHSILEMDKKYRAANGRNTHETANPRRRLGAVRGKRLPAAGEGPERRVPGCAPAAQRAFLKLALGELVLLHNWLLHQADVNATDLSRRAFSVCDMDGRRGAANGETFPPLFAEPHAA